MPAITVQTLTDSASGSRFTSVGVDHVSTELDDAVADGMAFRVGFGGEKGLCEQR